MKILIAVFLSLALVGCVTPKDLREAIAADKDSYNRYLAAQTAIAADSKVRIRCDSPCDFELPGAPSTVPDNPVASASEVSRAMQAQANAAASVGAAAVSGYFSLEQVRESNATSRHIASQRLQEAELREQSVTSLIEANTEMFNASNERVGELIELLAPPEEEEPEEPEEPEEVL